MGGEDKVKRGGGSNNNNGAVMGNTEGNYSESDFFNKNRILFDKIAVIYMSSFNILIFSKSIANTEILFGTHCKNISGKATSSEYIPSRTQISMSSTLLFPDLQTK